MSDFDPTELARLAEGASAEPWEIMGGNEYLDGVGVGIGTEWDNGIRLRDAEFIAYVGTHRAAIVSLVSRAEEAETALARVKEANELIHAHRFDLEEPSDDLVCGEERRGGPDCFYNGAEFAHKRIRAALHGVPSQPDGDPR